MKPDTKQRFLIDDIWVEVQGFRSMRYRTGESELHRAQRDRSNDEIPF